MSGWEKKSWSGVFVLIRPRIRMSSKWVRAFRKSGLCHLPWGKKNVNQPQDGNEIFLVACFLFQVYPLCHSNVKLISLEDLYLKSGLQLTILIIKVA